MTEEELADFQKHVERGEAIPITVDVPLAVVQWIEEEDLNIRRIGDETPRNAAMMEQIRAELRMMIIHSFMDNFRPAHEPEDVEERPAPDDDMPF